MRVHDVNKSHDSGELVYNVTKGHDSGERVWRHRVTIRVREHVDQGSESRMIRLEDN